MSADFIISFIIPSYQQGIHLKKCLDSISEQGLSREQYELLVYDGGSEDDTIELLKKHSIHPTWVSQPDHGQASAVNCGLQEAKGKVIAWINSDDYYMPGAIKKVLNFFNKHPEVEILYGDADIVNETGHKLYPYPTEKWNYAHLADLCFICQPATFFRASLIEKHGLLDESLDCAIDYEYWLRIGKSQELHYIKEPLACSRLYGDAKTLRMKTRSDAESLFVSRRHTGKWSDKWRVGLARHKTKDWMSLFSSKNDTIAQMIYTGVEQNLDFKLSGMEITDVLSSPPKDLWDRNPDELGKFIEMLDKDRNAWKENAESAQNEVEAAHESLRSAHASNKEFQLQIEELDTNHRKEIAEFREQIEKLEKHGEKHGQRIEDLAHQLTALRGNFWVKMGRKMKIINPDKST